MGERLLRLAPVALALLLCACTNYHFRPASNGSLDVKTLVDALAARQPAEPQYLQEVLWIPLLYRSVTRFQRTERTMEPDYPVGGFTLARERSVGPIGFFWNTSEVRHHDGARDLYHSSTRWGVGRRLVGEVRVTVRGEDGPFEFRQGELLFGLLKTERQGYPAPLVLSFPRSKYQPVPEPKKVFEEKP